MFTRVLYYIEGVFGRTLWISLFGFWFGDEVLKRTTSVSAFSDIADSGAFFLRIIALAFIIALLTKRQS